MGELLVRRESIDPTPLYGCRLTPPNSTDGRVGKILKGVTWLGWYDDGASGMDDNFETLLSASANILGIIPRELSIKYVRT